MTSLASHMIFSTPTPKLHGYDFSHQGLFGIWEGFAPISAPTTHSVDDTPIAVQRSLLLDVPGTTSIGYHSLSGSSTNSGFERQSSRRSHSPADDLWGNWNAALTALAERRPSDKLSWKPTIPTAKAKERLLALNLCGWNVQEDVLRNNVKR